MKIARYWAREKLEEADPRGGILEAVSWGWSADSIEEARRRARESAGRLAKWLRNVDAREDLARSEEYAYFCDRPPREEIIEEFHDANGEPKAVITRNSYGSLVLNARDLMFVDVDLPRTSAGESLGRLIGSIFGKRYTSPEDAVLQRFRDWAAAQREFTFRLYRTAAGFRAAIVDRPMNALSERARQILEELNSDPLYRRLCESQECFRARLTPKPWRMEVGKPPARYPFDNSSMEEQYREWVEEYDQKQTTFATCQFIEQFGGTMTHPDLEPLVKLHDELTQCETGRPLA